MVDVAEAVCPEIRTTSAFKFIQKNCKSHRRNEQSFAMTDDTLQTQATQLPNQYLNKI
jgi:hypothetical protein